MIEKTRCLIGGCYHSDFYVFPAEFDNGNSKKEMYLLVRDYFETTVIKIICALLKKVEAGMMVTHMNTPSDPYSRSGS